jgi:hypothetical protein
MACVARFQPGVGFFVVKAGQLHRVVDAQCLGQGLGRLGRAHVLHRVAADQSLAAEPGIETAPARQDQSAMPRAAAARAVHLRNPAADVGV